MDQKILDIIDLAKIFCLGLNSMDRLFTSSAPRLIQSVSCLFENFFAILYIFVYILLFPFRKVKGLNIQLQ